ncbi:MAG: cation transporter [Holophagales bacterium]|nr:MAG: cation transporter [Holophagales bacterium]
MTTTESAVAAGSDRAPGEILRRATFASLVVGLAVMGLKFVAFTLTGSVALLSDALESIVNVVAAVAAMIAIRVALRPADETHPFGHHKAEYFSAGLEGALILVAAGTIFYEAVAKLSHPEPPNQLGLGLAFSVVASLANLALALLLIRTGTRHRSPALVADGRHVQSDVISSFGVLIGIGLAWATGWWILDPIVAILVALQILWIGAKTVWGSMGGLMDEALPAATIAEIAATIQGSMGQALEFHDLRTRQAGPTTFVEFHLVVPGALPVAEAHGVCDEIERALSERFGGAHISIHVEPEGEARHLGYER